MLITRTPLRLSIGGGGTDLPSYYSKHGGFVIAAAINRYIYIALHKTFQKTYIIKYSTHEVVERVSDIKHPIVRTAFENHELEPYLEMVSLSDIPAGTGLGSSGSFGVGLLKAIYSMKRVHIPTQELAEEACSIEIHHLKEPVGKQDQYIAAFGGFVTLEIEKNGSVKVAPLRLSSETLHDLEDHLLIFFTGYSRSASEILLDQKKKSDDNDSKMFENLHLIKELGLGIRKALENGKTNEFGALMHQHWLFKRQRSQSISNSEINTWYEVGMANGAIGGKLVGAGGGGFLMFYASDCALLRKAMAQLGLQEVRFSFEFEGSKVLVQN